jgi:hypothetical protein
MNKFYEHSHGKLNSAAENAWYNHCRKHQIPYIAIKSRTKLADVHWDYLSYSKENEQKLSRHGKSINEFAIEQFHLYSKNAGRTANYTVCGNLIWLKNLAITDARSAAENLYDYIDDLLRRDS